MIDRHSTSSTDGFSPTQPRTESLCLDGTWAIVPDSDAIGLRDQWFIPNIYPVREAKSILVPGNTYEALPDFNGISWYKRDFRVEILPSQGRRSFLQFESVQYLCQVWLNGEPLGGHEGADSPFEFETSGKLAEGLNTIILRVENPKGVLSDGMFPVFYDQGGILGHVDLVNQPVVRISDVYVKPDPHTGHLEIEITCDNAGLPTSLELQAEVAERDSGVKKKHEVLTTQISTGIHVKSLRLTLSDVRKWDLHDPFLYSVTVSAMANGEVDTRRIERIGFRDFRMVDGYFQLNGRRIFLKCTHHNRYDPILQQGTGRDMTYLGQDARKLKEAGFNAFRSIAAPCLPEQLAIADEVGLLMFSEHGGSWHLKDSSKFKQGMLDVLRRDRNSPSLVIFGFLNEIEKPDVYKVAVESLPEIRNIDDTRFIMLSSGRWDGDLVIGSASSPGSKTWDVSMGGEGPKPILTGDLPDLCSQGYRKGGFFNGAGDIHVYHQFPLSWEFIHAFRALGGDNTRPIFMSEGGCGSVFDCYTEFNRLTEARAPRTAKAWNWAEGRIKQWEELWARYDLKTTYPEIPAMIAASQQAAALERDLFTRAIRANPSFCGYSLTSMTDAFGLGEGIWDNFRGWKVGHEEVIKAGWAPTRFCLFASPTPLTPGQPFRMVAAFADEDRLPAGKYEVVLRIRDGSGFEHWTTRCPLKLEKPGIRPLATILFDAELPGLALTEGHIILEASLDRSDRLAGDRLKIPVYDPAKTQRIEGAVQIIGIGAALRAVLKSSGAEVVDYEFNAQFKNQTIVCSAELPPEWNTDSWRRLYSQVARGDHLLLMGPGVLKGPSGPTHFLPLAQRGKLTSPNDWLYHREFLAKPGTVFEGLPTGILTGEIYGSLLRNVAHLSDATPPQKAIAIAFNGSGMGELDPGIIIGTWALGAGSITYCTLDLEANLGTPIADRLLSNLVREAGSSVSSGKDLSADFDIELDELGI